MDVRKYFAFASQKWISGVTDIVIKSTSSVEMQNIPILLKTTERMNHKYNGHNS